MPFPRVFVMRVAAADRDRTGEHVTIVDVPAFLTGIGRSAAGEFGHSSSNCGIEGVGKPSYSLSLKIRATLQGIQQKAHLIDRMCKPPLGRTTIAAHTN